MWSPVCCYHENYQMEIQVFMKYTVEAEVLPHVAYKSVYIMSASSYMYLLYVQLFISST